MVTAPNYDPELLSGKNKGNNHRVLEETYGKPLLNRAIQGNYPPGSTFKPSQGAIFSRKGYSPRPTPSPATTVIRPWATTLSATATPPPHRSSQPSRLVQRLLQLGLAFYA